MEKYPNIIDGLTNGTWTFGTNMTEQPSLQGISTNAGLRRLRVCVVPVGRHEFQQPERAHRPEQQQIPNGSVCSGHLEGHAQTDAGLRSALGLRHLLPRTVRPQWFDRSRDREPVGRRTAGGAQFEATCNCKFANNYPYAVGPRLGLAYQIDDKDRAARRYRCGLQRHCDRAGSTREQRCYQRASGNSGQITGLFKDGMPASRPTAVARRLVANVGHPVGAVIAMPGNGSWTRMRAVRHVSCSGTSGCSGRSTAIWWSKPLMLPTVVLGGRPPRRAVLDWPIWLRSTS